MEANTASPAIDGAVNEKDYAVVIGIRHYTDLQELQGPIRDAELFRCWLTDTKNGGGLPHENVLFIPSDNSVKPYAPIQDQIDEALYSIEKLGEKTGFRRLYFYFSGHGIGASWDDTGLCLPKWSQKWRNHALSSQEYFNYFVASDLFEEVLFFLDCCRTRVINARPFYPGVGWAREGGAKTRRSMSLYATNFEDAAREALATDGSDLYVTGYFTRALVEGLRGAAVEPDGTITDTRLFEFVRSRTQELARANNHKQFAKRGNGETDGPIIIKAGLPQPKATVEISFPGAGHYRLENQNLSEVKESRVEAGDTWVIDGLELGTYCLINLMSKGEDFFRVNGTKEKIDHVCKC